MNVSGFNDSPMRFDQLVRIINETERLLGIPYPAPAVTMLQVSNLDDGFCGNNQMSYATRYVADPYVVENSAIKIRVNAECNKTFASIAHEVAHTWFHGNNDWIDEGLANAIEYQLLATYRPIQAIYPPVTYCQDLPKHQRTRIGKLLSGKLRMNTLGSHATTASATASWAPSGNTTETEDSTAE